VTEDRPTPEQMLARLKTEGVEEGSLKRRGRLKVFFGYAAGVGKTYAMLQAARTLKADGRDVVVGYVEPHGRPETEALLEGLEQLPVLQVPYRGAVLREFNLDAALERCPELILVDELAHTNAPTMRHAKRWQDIEELLAAGIDVFTTVNIQHVESLNDVIAQISGVTVRETVPDEVLERADDIALIDLTPDELVERLRQGKVYIPEKVAWALENFFRKEKLLALREIALRHTADYLSDDVETARLGVAARVPWPTNERMLVCVGPSPTSAKVVRAAKRLADRLHAEWVAVHVETPQAERMSEQARQLLMQNLRLAETLGADIIQLSGDDVVVELLDYANRRNVTKIVIGKTGERRERFSKRRPLVDRLLENSGNTDVFVVRGLEGAERVETTAARAAASPAPWLLVAGAMALATAVAWGLHLLGFGEANLVMVYLLAVVLVAARVSIRPAIGAALLAVVLFDVLFVPPFYRLTVHDAQYLVTFTVMLAVGLLSSALMSRVRRQAEVSRTNERRTEALYRLSQRLSGAVDTGHLLDDSERAVAEMFDAYAVIFLPDEHRLIRPVLGHAASFAASAAEFGAAQWVLDKGQPAGLGASTLPSLEARYVPLVTPNGVAGVLALQPHDTAILQSPEARQLLDTFATQIALAIERQRLMEDAQRARVQMETEKLRSSLLSAVSHDLRTPLAAISGAGSSLRDAWATLNEATRDELLDTVCDESERMARLIENLLQMTRLSSGKITINKQWHPLEEVIGSALHRMERQLRGREVEVEIPAAFPLCQFDDVLVEQMMINLLDNAVKYSQPGTPIVIRAERLSDAAAIEVADRGEGFRPGDEGRVFEMFFRGAEGASRRRGSGLGLAICRAIADAHGGSIHAANRPGGGASVRFTLPFDSPPPQVVVEPETSVAQL
jgi:two-component system sensor histidine kinase KdpD